MWTIIKFDPKKINLLKEDLKKKLGKDFIIYRPKLLIQKYKNNKLINKEIALLGNYIFCYHNKFNNHKIICELKYLRGIKYFLNGFLNNPSEIKIFIDKCKNLENEKGFITSNLFEKHLNTYYKFRSGPFAEKIFKIIDLQRDKIDILMGNIRTTIRTQKFLFSPV